jgi:outer membrane protein OmpA-like peptidoglycan-associated protein
MSERRTRTLPAVGLAAWAALCALSTHAAAIATPTAATGVDAPRPTAASRELDRAQALLQLRLASLPEGSAVLLLRDPERLTLRIPARVLFAADSASLKKDPAAAAPLAASVQVLRKHRRLQAQIVVYTDSLGEVGANQSLSDQRAQAVYEALSKAGIAADRLQQHGAGAATMVAGNDTPPGRIENRRVEIEFERAGPPG